LLTVLLGMVSQLSCGWNWHISQTNVLLPELQ
jgi:hypothetical protein